MKKYRSAILGLIVIIAGVFIFITLIRSKRQAEPVTVAMEAPKVQVQKVQLSSIPYAIEVTGVLRAKNRIELYSETQGVLKRLSKEFKIGTRFQRGQTLIEIDSREFESEIKSSRSNLMNQIASMLADMQIDYPNAYKKWEVYLEQFHVDKPTPELPTFETNEEKLFVSGRNIYQTYYSIRNLEQRLSKYEIVAPFRGIVIESNINTGTLVRSGQKLGEFIDDSVFEISLSVPASDNEFLSLGSEVLLTSIDGNSTYQGNVLRVNGSVDQVTQTVSVVVEIKSQKLKEGQYLKASIQGKQIDNAMEIDNSLIVEDNKVYVVQGDQLALKEVQVLNYNQSKVLVQGLENNMLLVSESIAKAYPGMKIEVK